MKILKQEIQPKTREGYAVLLPEEPEDMWHIYNVVCEGDEVRAQTFRKVVKELNNGDYHHAQIL
jgi:protein pelota